MSELSKLAHQAMMQPQGALQEVGRKKNELFIGIPKEISFQENRVPLTPLSVALLVERGHRVVMESGAGERSNFLDHHYSEQGAEIVRTPEEVYKADIIIKIAAPTMDEIGLMRENQTLLSCQQPTLMDGDCLKTLMKKRITAISYEYL